MNNAQTMAIAKAISEKTAKIAREGLTVGDHEVDITVNVRGKLSVFEDTEKTPTVSIPMKETLALFIRYAGITGPHAVNLLRRAMTDALAANDEGEQNHSGAGAIREAMPILAEVENTIVAELLASLPKTKVKGQCRAYVKVTELGQLVGA